MSMLVGRVPGFKVSGFFRVWRFGAYSLRVFSLRVLKTLRGCYY